MKYRNNDYVIRHKSGKEYYIYDELTSAYFRAEELAQEKIKEVTFYVVDIVISFRIKLST